MNLGRRFSASTRGWTSTHEPAVKRIQRLTGLTLLVLFAALPLACSGGGKSNDASAAALEPQASATPKPAQVSNELSQYYATATIAAEITATAEAAFWQDAAAAATPSASLELTAENFQFDKQVLVVPAGSTVELTFVNKDNIAHNFAIYRDEQYQDKVFAADLVTSPGTVKFSFEAPPRGTYYFICQPHRGAMYGRLIVK
jgi:plastocyanin